jgi:ankyrin repeat protein
MGGWNEGIIMEYFTQAFEKLKELGMEYRKRAYYYYGYLHLELRLAQHGGKPSEKYEAVRTNDFETIEKNVYNGTWRVNDCVSINNMTTMLHEAVVLDRREILSFLLRQGADPNIRDRNGMTPLLKAAALGRDYAVIELLKFGVNPHHIDPFGFTPYELAIFHEEAATAELLKNVNIYTKTETKWFWPPDI